MRNRDSLSNSGRTGFFSCKNSFLEFCLICYIARFCMKIDQIINRCVFRIYFYTKGNSFIFLITPLFSYSFSFTQIPVYQDLVRSIGSSPFSPTVKIVLKVSQPGLLLQVLLKMQLHCLLLRRTLMLSCNHALQNSLR